LEVFQNLQLLSYREDGGTKSIIQSHDKIRIALWAGPGQDLATWRDRLQSIYQVSFGDEQSTTVCGRPARKQEAVVSSAGATGAVVGDSGVVGHVYQDATHETHVAVAFTQKNTEVVLSWAVPTSEREEYKPDEDRLFDSIVCH